MTTDATLARRILRRLEALRRTRPPFLSRAEGYLLDECLCAVREEAARPLAEVAREAATDGPNPLAEMIGKWPGDETDGEIAEALYGSPVLQISAISNLARRIVAGRGDDPTDECAIREVIGQCAFDLHCPVAILLGDEALDGLRRGGETG